MQTDREARAYDALSQHARLADIASVAQSVMARLAAKPAADERGAPGRAAWVAAMAAERGLTRDEAATPFGNAVDVLQRGPEDAAERALACALAAHAIALHPPAGSSDEDRAAGDLLWLAAHTELDATTLLDRALGEAAAPLWTAFAERIRAFDQGNAGPHRRTEAIVASLALAASTATGAAERAAALASDVSDPKLARALGRAERKPASIAGEVTSAPRGPVATTLMGVTGVLLALRLAQVVGRVALSFRRPGEITLTPEGDVRVRWRVLLLGSTLRDREVVVPRAALARAERDVRFARAGFYAGLLALAAGSYVGVATFVDGVRAASPPMLGAGLAIVAAGVALDFALSCLAPSAGSRCRVLLVTRAGSRLCLGCPDVGRADALLARLAGR